MRRLIVGLAVLLASSFVISPAASASGGASHRNGVHKFVYFNSYHHIYRAPAADPTDRTSLPVPGGKTTLLKRVAISPNGKRLVEDLYWAHAARGHGRCTKNEVCERIGVAHADGTHVRWILTGTDHPTDSVAPAWGPDSKTIFYSAQYADFSRQADDYLVSIHLGHPLTTKRVMGSAGLTDPTPSPDGKFLAAVKPTFDSEGSATQVALVTLRLSTGTVSAPLLRKHTTPGVTGVVGYQDPVWSPDGSKIAVVIADQQDGPQDNERGRIVVVAADGSDHGDPTKVATGGQVYFVHEPAWRTSHQLWFSRNFFSFNSTDNERRTSNANLYAVNIDGHTASTARRRTHTKKIDEQYASFSMP